MPKRPHGCDGDVGTQANTNEESLSLTSQGPQELKVVDSIT